MMASLRNGRRAYQQVRTTLSSIVARWNCSAPVSRWKATRFAQSHKTASGRAEGPLPTDRMFHSKRFASP
jgi:hypothetical protein